MSRPNEIRSNAILAIRGCLGICSYAASLAVIEFSLGLSNLEDTIVGIVGSLLLFGGLALIAGLINFSWKEFKDDVLLQRSTAVWIVGGAILGVFLAIDQL